MARRKVEEWLFELGADLDRFSPPTHIGAPRMARQRGWSPRVDVFETAQEVIVRFELAGVRRDHISLAYDPQMNALRLRGIRQDPLMGQEGLYANRLEIEFGEFERVVELPSVPISVRHAQTQFHGGILIVVLPKEGAVVVEHTVTVRKI